MEECTAERHSHKSALQMLWSTGLWKEEMQLGVSPSFSICSRAAVHTQTLRAGACTVQLGAHMRHPQAGFAQGTRDGTGQGETRRELGD